MNNRHSSASKRATSRRSSSSPLRTTVGIIQAVILLCMSALVGITLGLFISLSRLLPKVETMDAPEATIVYSDDGVILGRIFREDRTNVPLSEIPQSLRNACIAIEDSRFYHHAGVDMRGIARAFYKNVMGHRLSEGGSTITQQLARNVYLSQKKTIERKLREAVLAILIERNFTKDKILELYLNRIYFGSGAFGVQAAARTYFGKDADQLSLSEAALIAGIPRRPTSYSPHEDPQSALKRRNIVLSRMHELGYITASQTSEAKSEKLKVVPRIVGRNTYRAPHFVDYVIKQLRERYADDVIFNGGLRVYTTLHYGMQKAAEKALRDGVHKHEQSRHVSEGCFVCIEPASGYIRAMVGSVDPASQYNRAVQGDGRQPGSLFKAFVYTAAFSELHKRPSDRVLDERVSYPGAGGRLWKPKNYDNKYQGWVTIRTAVAMSMNMPAIRTAEQVGIKEVIRYAHMMGITTELQPYLSTAIGASCVHPLEMAAAYGTFANDGVFVPSCAIVRITNAKEDVIEDFRPKGKNIISSRVNDMMDQVLRAVVTHGTGKSARSVAKARGKTGTTNNDRDAWFIGYVPGKLVAACWVGNDNNSSMRSAYGGKVCAPIWSEFMLKALPAYDAIKRKQGIASQVQGSPAADTKTHKDPLASDVSTVESESVSCKICKTSGLLATALCPSWRSKTFIKGTEPTQSCDVHAIPEADTSDIGTEQQDLTTTEIIICPDSGLLAGASCPVKRKTRVPIDEAPTTICDFHNPTP